MKKIIIFTLTTLFCTNVMFGFDDHPTPLARHRQEQAEKEERRIQKCNRKERKMLRNDFQLWLCCVGLTLCLPYIDR